MREHLHTELCGVIQVAHMTGHPGSLVQLLLDSRHLSLEAARGRDSLLGHWQLPTIGTECKQITKETSNSAGGL